MNGLVRFLRSEWLVVRTQIGLGAVFIAAALPKLKDPPTFAHNVWAYHLLPDGLVNLQALLLPGVELVAGLALVVGLWPRAASLVCVAMLAMFMAALGLALAAGNPVICSCFDLAAANLTDAQKLAQMRGTLLRDLALLLLPEHVLWVRTVGSVGIASAR